MTKPIVLNAQHRALFDVLKAEWGAIKFVDPSSAAYKKTFALLDAIPDEFAAIIAAEKIPVISEFCEKRRDDVWRSVRRMVEETHIACGEMMAVN